MTASDSRPPELLSLLCADPSGGEVVRRVVQQPLRLPEQDRELRVSDAHASALDNRTPNVATPCGYRHQSPPTSRTTSNVH